MRIRLSDYEEILKALGEGLELALEIVFIYLSWKN